MVEPFSIIFWYGILCSSGILVIFIERIWILFQINVFSDKVRGHTCPLLQTRMSVRFSTQQWFKIHPWKAASHSVALPWALFQIHLHPPSSPSCPVRDGVPCSAVPVGAVLLSSLCCVQPMCTCCLQALPSDPLHPSGKAGRWDCAPNHRRSCHGPGSAPFPSLLPSTS